MHIYTHICVYMCVCVCLKCVCVYVPACAIYVCMLAYVYIYIYMYVIRVYLASLKSGNTEVQRLHHAGNPITMERQHRQVLHPGKACLVGVFTFIA